ncbi:MAG: hypothetical protein EHM59_09750 [Betaproteobacteria bacterium]|nr:MAG: hypothetical protein EHM59_09750 [Betaproteobacteria bacterium]
MIHDLPKDPVKALGEILFWLDSINTTDGFRLERRFDLVNELDLAAKAHVRKLSQEYFQLRDQKFQENRIWTAQTEYWRLTAAGYIQCVEGFKTAAAGATALRTRLPVVVGRALHALRQLLKWSLLRYGPVDGLVWSDLGSLYAFAEAKGFAELVVPLYEGAVAGTSAHFECLKTVMLAVVSTDSLPPAEIEIAERSVALFAPHYVIDRTASPACPYVFDVAMSRPPGRIHSGLSTSEPSLRYFGPGGASEEVNRLLGILLEQGVLPSDASLGGEYEAQAIADVWRHLLQYWAPTPPQRSSIRHVAQVRLSVVQGFKGLADTLTITAEHSLDFSAGTGPPVESWFADNASVGGYGVVVPVRGNDWVHVGGLIGVKVEGDKYWGSGVVRRIRHESEQNLTVGVQLLAQVCVPIRLAPYDVVLASNAIRDNDLAILLTPRPDSDRGVKIMLPAGAYSPGQGLEMRVHDQVFQIEPVKLLEGTEEYDIARFVLVRRIG